MSEPRPITPVGIAAALLTRLAARLGEAGEAPADVLADLHRAEELTGGLEPYLAATTTPASEALARLEADTNGHDWDQPSTNGQPPTLEREMLSGHVEGQLLRLLIGVAGARTALDIGMFTGYSALAMAEGMPDDGQVVACEVEPDVAVLARRLIDRSPHGRKITIKVGPAAQTLTQLVEDGRQFDVAFIDADKGGYVGYLRQLLDGRLVRPGGLVLADNTLLQGQPWSSGARSEAGAAIAAFNEVVLAEDRVEQVLVPLRDGLTIMRVHPDG